MPQLGNPSDPRTRIPGKRMEGRQAIEYDRGKEYGEVDGEA
jgi:hypothetical protein